MSLASDIAALEESVSQVDLLAEAMVAAPAPTQPAAMQALAATLRSQLARFRADLGGFFDDTYTTDFPS